MHGPTVVTDTPLSTEPRIEHVIVLMLENRSFDHMLGFLPHPDPTFDGLAVGGHYNNASSGTRHDATDDGEPDLANPDHSNEGVLVQIGPFGSRPFNGGFVRSYETYKGSEQGPMVMRCLRSLQRCPVLAQLALGFAVCDAWFSSVPGETWPNRNFAHAATSDSSANIELGFYYDPTIFEQLAAAAATWRVYHDGPAQLWCFRRLWQRRTLTDVLLRRTPKIANWFPQEDFAAHVRSGNLASYTFIEPAHLAGAAPAGTNSQHPNNNQTGPQDFYAGEALIKSVYDALVITYDEHGGLYDHVRPPAATPPGDPVWRGWSRRLLGFVRMIIDRLAGRSPGPAFPFDQLGVRVPAVLVSPWIRPGTVIHTQLEHASIPKTLRALFAPKLASLTQRDHAAKTFHQVVREHGLNEPRAASGAATRGRSTPMPELIVAVVDAVRDARGSGRDAARTVSEFDAQLLDLSERVHRELERPTLLPTRPPVRPADDARPRARTTAAAATDAFEAHARAAR